MKQNKPNIKMLKFYLEIKICLNEWRNILHLWVEISNIVDMSLFPKLILKLSIISMIIIAVFYKNEQVHSKTYMEI